jgi:Holliday junction resolvase RusA-like endonuclease
MAMTGIPPLATGRSSAGVYVIDIPDWHPTPLNKLLGHHQKAGRLKRHDREMVWAYVKQARVPADSSMKRSVELTIILGPKQRACDPDAYFKSLCDALVHAMALWDDSREYCELLPVRFDRGSRKATRIVLRDVA